MTVDNRVHPAPPGTSPVRAALSAAASLPPPEPVPSVTYHSRGRTLIVGPAERVLPAADELAATNEVTVLVTSGSGTAQKPSPAFALHFARAVQVNGYLGDFAVRWEEGDSPDPVEREHGGTFDVVLDLGDAPLFTMSQPPQGYFAPGADAQSLSIALEEIRDAVGDFEKPRYFHYDASICAHSRARLEGCSQCIDICSTRAISAHGDGILVEPHLCMGCGGCATVCPSGAMAYAYPGVDYQGGRIKAMLDAFDAAGGRDACLLLHDEAGAQLIADLEHRGSKLPERVIPLPVHHIASVGLDLALGAIVLGVNQLRVLGAGTEPEGYRAAIAQQLGFGQTLLEALGYGRGRLELLEAKDALELEKALGRLQSANQGPPPAAFKLFDRKRTTLWFAIDHLAAHAPAPKQAVPMPHGAPFGAIEVDREACTLCMACVGACPENAMLDGRDRPQLRFVEANCVQCGLCERACPEDAITLAPRVSLSETARREVLLNEDAPFRCIRCGKEFATGKVIESMVGRLAGHSMFASSDALNRIRMCADCRVIDMMEKKSEVSILDLKR
jgi:ferredoxin